LKRMEKKVQGMQGVFGGIGMFKTLEEECSKGIDLPGAALAKF